MIVKGAGAMDGSIEAERQPRQDERSVGEARLRRANARKQTIELRPPNRGKKITESLPGVHIDPATLDLYSEVQPLDELVGAMRDKWTMISIDADIEIDSPVNLHMADYCDACRRCIRACPGRAIPEERIWWRGVLKRKINDTKCYPYFLKFEGCGNCLKVCPIHRFGYEECMSTYEKHGTIPRKGSSSATQVKEATTPPAGDNT